MNWEWRVLKDRSCWAQCTPFHGSSGIVSLYFFQMSRVSCQPHARGSREGRVKCSYHPIPEVLRRASERSPGTCAGGKQGHQSCTRQGFGAENGWALHWSLNSHLVATGFRCLAALMPLVQAPGLSARLFLVSCFYNLFSGKKTFILLLVSLRTNA